MRTLLPTLLIFWLQIGTSYLGCAPTRYDIAFYLVRDTEVDSSAFINQRNFSKEVIAHFSVGYMQTRFSCHVYGSTAAKYFDFVSKTTTDGLNEAFNNIVSATNKTGDVETIENVKYIWETIFTEANGDRPDVPNYCIMFATGETNDTHALAGNEKPDTLNLRVIDAQSAYKYKDYYTDNQFSHFATVRTISSLTKWSDVQPEIGEFTKDFTCNFYCDVNYFTFDEPENLNSNSDTATGKLIVLMDSPWNITCCGVISSWIFYAKAAGTITFAVFRPTTTGTTTEYTVIGYNQIIIPDIYIDTLVEYNAGEGEKIAIIEGDKVGWYSSGANIISYSTCTTTERTDCPQSTKQYTLPTDIADGVVYDFSSATIIPNKAFSLKFTTKNNTEMYIRTNENETELEENTAIGKQAIFLTVVDPDYENHTFQMTGNLTYLELNTEKMSIDLKAKFPKGGGGPYVVTVAGYDTCQHSATVTLTVGTYNAPPVINNLPHIHEILETTNTAVQLFQINVTDATNDEICCTLPFTLPNTFNFRLISTPVENGTDLYYLWTVDEPAFEYSDIDSFRVFVCCQDKYGSSYSYLILRLVEVKQVVPYVPPNWFFRALYLSLTPICMMTLLSCFTLVYSVFWL